MNILNRLNYDNIIEDVAWRTEDGTVDWRDPKHLDLLKQSLKRMGVSEIMISEVCGTIQERFQVLDELKLKDGTDISNQYIENPETGRDIQLKSVHGKADYYKDNFPKTYQKYKAFMKRHGYVEDTDSAKYITPEKQEKKKSNSLVSKDIMDKSKSKSQNINTKSNISNKNISNKIDKKVYNIIISKLDNSNVTEKATPFINKFKKAIHTLYNSNNKSKIANEFKDFNLTTNSSRKKLYLNDLKVSGNDRKLFSKGGSESERNLIKKLEYYLGPIPSDSGDLSMIKLETAAKPDLGHGVSLYNRTASNNKNRWNYTNELSDDPILNKLFSNPPLNQIEKREYKILIGPQNEKGHIIQSGGKNSKIYLKHSIENNKSIDKVIKLLNNLAIEGRISPQLSQSVKQHKKRMTDILNNYDIPSKKASQAVDSSYAKMFDELYNVDPESSSKILKQFAEMRLYDSEVANGDEVYLPESNIFPAGDKIFVDTNKSKLFGERVSFISVKYGKTGDVYGCPANTSAIQRLHPDKNKRNLLGNYIGEDGKLLCITDDVLSDKNKAFDYISNILSEQGYGDLFSKNELIKLSEISVNFKNRIKKIKEMSIIKNKVNWSLFQKNMKNDKLLNSLNGSLKDIVSVERFIKLIGTRNGRVANAAKFNPAIFLTGITWSNIVRTSNGLEFLKHNKQYYDNGTLKNITTSGTTNMHEWYIDFRMNRTSGRSGGGAQSTYIGEELLKKYPIGSL